jgi:hypothetical protein
MQGTVTHADEADIEANRDLCNADGKYAESLITEEERR